MPRLPSFAGTRNRRARQHARKGIVLRDVGVTKATQVRYYNAASLLCKTVEDASDMEDLDEQVGDWIQIQFARGAPLNVVADALSGLHFFVPSTKKRLPLSWRLLGTWRRMEVPSRAPPLPEDLMWAMVSYCLQHARFDLGCLVALAFHCFLRTGEALAVRPCDLLLKGNKGIVHLPKSKGGTRHNIQESVTIYSETIAILMDELVQSKRRQGLSRVPIWMHSGTKFREEFLHLVRVFKVAHLGFRGYSLRRGGATAYFQQCGLMEKTLLRGRWASIAVARLYLCDALAQLPALVASSETKKLITQFRAFWSTD